MTEQTGCFKPCSNWNTFNTNAWFYGALNLKAVKF